MNLRASSIRRFDAIAAAHVGAIDLACSPRACANRRPTTPRPRTARAPIARRPTRARTRTRRTTSASERDYDEAAAESARELYRLQGKAGCDRVLEALKRERESVKETRQYLFGRLLNLQLEEAVLRDHLNATVNEASDGARDGARGSRREVEARETASGAET
jgi:hypothetical protein